MTTGRIKRRILKSLSALFDMEPTSEDEMATWLNRAKDVRSLMKLDHGNLQVPHALWHFLGDVDIRMKDGSYAKAQMSQIKEALCNWEANGATQDVGNGDIAKNQAH